MAGEGLATDARAESRGEGLWIEGREHDAGGARHDGFTASVVRDADVRHVMAPGVRARLVYVDSLAHAGAEAEPGGHLTAPMSGTVVAVMVAVGDAVDKGAALIVLEAMKMEHTIVAPASGRVAAVHFAVGDRVGEGADLVDVEDAR
jgi:3-methylcrotonyl-CoA carboxylase alpha subunit